jgi:hypothetical protein
VDAIVLGGEFPAQLDEPLLEVCRSAAARPSASRCTRLRLVVEFAPIASKEISAAL